MRHFIFISAATLFFFTTTISYGSSLDVSPVRLHIEPGKKTTSVTISNKGSEKMTVQLSAVKWEFDALGADKYSDTSELAFYPKIMTIDAGENRIIRIGYEGGKKRPVEKSFRLFVEELPSDLKDNTVKMALRMALPVFIRPNKVVRDSAITKAMLYDGIIMTMIENSGNSHEMVEKLTARGFDKEGNETFSLDYKGWYLLAEKSKQYLLALDEEACKKSATIKINATLDTTHIYTKNKNRTNLESIVTVDPSMCVSASSKSSKQQ